MLERVTVGRSGLVAACVPAMARHGSGLHQWRCGNGNSNLTPAQVVQVDVIVALQSTLGLRKNAPIATLMRVVSVLGTGRVVYPACIACTWFWDVDVGTALQELLVLILVVMAACKTAFKMPRCVLCRRATPPDCHHSAVWQARGFILCPVPWVCCGAGRTL